MPQEQSGNLSTAVLANIGGAVARLAPHLLGPFQPFLALALSCCPTNRQLRRSSVLLTPTWAYRPVRASACSPPSQRAFASVASKKLAMRMTS